MPVFIHIIHLKIKYLFLNPEYFGCQRKYKTPLQELYI